MRFGHKDLPTSIVIQSWQGHDSIGRAAKEGYPGILSTGSLPRPASAYERSPLSHDPMPTGDTWLMISFIVARSSWRINGSSHAQSSWARVRERWLPSLKGGTVRVPRVHSDYNGAREEIYIPWLQVGQNLVGHFDNLYVLHWVQPEPKSKWILRGKQQLIGNVRWPTTGEVVIWK